MTKAPVTPDNVIQFWFEETPRRTWFNATPEFDAMVRSRFEAGHGAALAGDLDGWQGDAASMLALILILDQFSRNMFRGTPEAFSGDAKALACADRAVAERFDLAETEFDRRQFFYMPFTHAEDPDAQERGVTLMTERLAGHEAVPYALAHRDVIARFGRFPHRNAILGRTTTFQEQAYLDKGGGFR